MPKLSKFARRLLKDLKSTQDRVTELEEERARTRRRRPKPGLLDRDLFAPEGEDDGIEMDDAEMEIDDDDDDDDEKEKD